MSAIKDTRPPLPVVRVLNPFTKLAVRSPLGKRMPVAILRFTGRRSGRTYETPTSWYDTPDGPVVFTPSRWRVNFAQPHAVTTTVHGQTTQRTATLVRDPSEVARVLNHLLAAGKHGRPAGLKVAPGHELTADDVVAVDRAMLRFS